MKQTRRDILRAGVLGASGLLVNTTVGPRVSHATPVEDGWIDAHSHIWTRDVKRFPLAQGKTIADLNPPSFTAEELLQIAHPAGVKRVVLIQHQPYHGYDNSYLIDAAQRYPGSFKIVGMVDDSQPRPQDAMRRLLSQHVSGFRITPRNEKEGWLDGEGMAAMWRCAAETRQAICCLINPSELPSLGRMCAAFPDTPVVVDHLARIGVDGVIRDGDVMQLCELARHRSTFVKVSAFYALGAKSPPYLDLVPMIRRVYEAYGPRRLMWASDCPYQIQGVHTYQASISLIRDGLNFLDDDGRQWMLRKTAEQVYFNLP